MLTECGGNCATAFCCGSCGDGNGIPLFGWCTGGAAPLPVVVAAVVMAMSMVPPCLDGVLATVAEAPLLVVVVVVAMAMPMMPPC